MTVLLKRFNVNGLAWLLSLLLIGIGQQQSSTLQNLLTADSTFTVSQHKIQQQHAHQRALLTAKFLAIVNQSLASRYLDLWLLTVDRLHNQLQHYEQLDYQSLMTVIETAATYDAHNPNPLIMLSSIFVQTTVESQLQLLTETMLKLLENQPAENWPFAAQLAVLLYHQQAQPELAIKLANALQQTAAAPAWSRDLAMLFYEQQHHYEKALIAAQQRLQQLELNTNSASGSSAQMNTARQFIIQKQQYYQQQMLKNQQ